MLIFFFNDAATTEIYTLSLHDALPICHLRADRARLRDHLQGQRGREFHPRVAAAARRVLDRAAGRAARLPRRGADRKSTRLNSSHANISYAVFCLKKKQSSLASAKSLC